MNQKSLAMFSAPILSLILLIATWKFAIWFFEIPKYILPPPFEVASALWQNRQSLLRAGTLSFSAALCGFLVSLVVGTIVALIFSQSNWIRLAFFPYAVFLQTVPIVAIAPLIIIWFGTGFQSVVVVSFILSLFPILTNATAGLTRLNPLHVELFHHLNATRLQFLFKLRFPSAIPSLVTGAQIASGLSVIGAIVGEFFAGYGSNEYGLGYLIILSSGQLNTPLLFSAIFTSTALGFAVYSLVSILSTRLMKKWIQH